MTSSAIETEHREGSAAGVSVSAQSRGTVVFPSLSSWLEDEAFGLRRALHWVAACGAGVESSGRDDAPFCIGKAARQWDLLGSCGSSRFSS